MKNNSNKHQQGFVLITVLLIVTLLSALLLGVNAELRTESKAVADWQSTTFSLTTARSGLNIAIAAIQEDPDVLLNPDTRKLFNGQETLNLDATDCTITISEENGKLNVNELADKNGKLNRARVDQFLKLIDLHNEKYPTEQPITYSLAANLIDWTDNNDKETWLDFISRDNTGTESTYYQTQQPSYRCANRPFTTNNELLLVKDMPKTKNTKDFLNNLTVYGDGKININTVPLTTLRSLTEKITEPVAQAIITARQTKPFTTIEELKTLPDISETIFQTIQSNITTNPPIRYYQIIVRANHKKMQQTLTAIIQRNSNTDKIRIVYYKES